MTRRRQVSIVPHTHWDREWYAPFQAFRLRLVDTLDAFLPHLEADPSYTRFLLDGQMAVVDDYLDVRPEEEARLERLAASGRVAMGPWYTLMDEFLVSGETIIRDLQAGLHRANDFGGAMDVGYLPDMFGHVAQMPQVLRLAGIHHAVVWRGVPMAIDRAAFTWVAPDGTEVRAEYLLEGYGNGEGIGDDAKALVERLRNFEHDAGDRLPDGWPLLFMNGTDHQAPQPWLGRVVAEANAMQDDYEIRITSLPEHLAGAPADQLPAWHGELRSGARANLLMGVASNRTDVKQAAARAERALERRAEPLAALFLAATGRSHDTLLRRAWKEVLRNAAHDSVCACSVDEVCDAVLVRYAEARRIGEGIADRAVKALAASVRDAGWVVVNAAARPRGGVVALDVPGTGPMPGAQVVVERPAVVRDDTYATADEARVALAALTSQQLEPGVFVNEVDVDTADDGTTTVTLHVSHRLLTNFLVADAVRDIGAGGTGPIRVVARQVPSRRVLVRVDDVPGFGWRLVGDPVEPAHPVRGLGNGLVTVDVDPRTGAFSVNGTAGFDRLVDSLDAGDTYNYSPPPGDVVVDAPMHVTIAPLEDGPLRGRTRVERTYRWQGTDVTVHTLLEVRAGEPFVRVTTTFDNTCRNHRLRTHLPVPNHPVATSRAECAFAVVDRGLDAEGGPNERALPTFPSRRFVRAGDLTVVHEGLLEYELVDEGRGIALTLLRATGMLSGVDLAYRPLPAGPPIAIEGPQQLGPVEARYAICVDPGVDPYALADDVLLPLTVATTDGGGTRPASGSGLTVGGAEVSALRRVPGGLELRAFNPTPDPTTLVVEDRTGWEVDLRGGPIAPFDGTRAVRPWEIVTLLLGDADGGP